MNPEVIEMIKNCNYKFKHIKRANLRPKLFQRCRCSGKIVCYSHVFYSFGLNDGNNIRILLKCVNVEGINVDHVWIKSRLLNNSRIYKGKSIKFDAIVSSYQKINGDVGIGLVDLQNIKIISK